LLVTHHNPRVRSGSTPEGVKGLGGPFHWVVGHRVEFPAEFRLYDASSNVGQSGRRRTRDFGPRLYPSPPRIALK